MPLEMLNCSICPRQQEFSDISHLLTHVSSKAHLAHYHKLQVKSHQEIAAGVQLASYNQWYQEHGLAQLLSERMLMKEAKKANKRVSDGINKRENADVKEERLIDANPDQSSPSHQITRNRARSRAKRARRRQTAQEDESDVDWSPIQGVRRSQRLSYLITPVRRTPLPSSPPPGDETPAIDPALVPSGANAKLKGIIWPGMDMWDSAHPEDQRRRNQKKDGSVVKSMERLSKLVEPTEAVYTITGTLRKARHIDDLEDNSSLIEGETPVPKSKPRQKRKALARVSANIPRLVQRKVRAKKDRSAGHERNENGLPVLVQIPSSTARATEALQMQYTPTEEENAEFQLAVRNMPLRKRVGNFAIFTDNNAAYSPRLLSYPGQHMSLNQDYAVPMPQRLVIPSQAWLQPQNQNPLYVDNKYSYHPVYPAFQEFGYSKENVLPMASRLDAQTVNPLAWKSPLPSSSTEGQSYDSTFGNFSGYFDAPCNLPDPFGYAKNPLVDAFGHFAASHDGDLLIGGGEKMCEDSSSGSSSQEPTAVAALAERNGE